jgi:hypothetical protein
MARGSASGSAKPASAPGGAKPTSARGTAGPTSAAGAAEPASAPGAAEPTLAPRDAAGRRPGNSRLTAGEAMLAGRYRLEERLGDQYGSSVWKATDESLTRTVTVRTFAPHFGRTGEAVAAARSAAQLSDPRLVQIFDADDRGDPPYIVTEWPGGERLDEVIATGPLEPVRAAEIITEAAEGMTVAHAAGLAHLCLTPDRLWWNQWGEVKIGGLGTEAVLAEAEADNPAEADTRGLARLLYAALTGYWPGPEQTRLPAAPSTGGRPDSPAQVRPGISSHLDAVTCRALFGEANSYGPPILSPAGLVAALTPLAHPGENTQPLSSLADQTRPFEPVASVPPLTRPFTAIPGDAWPPAAASSAPAAPPWPDTPPLTAPSGPATDGQLADTPSPLPWLRSAPAAEPVAPAWPDAESAQDISAASPAAPAKPSAETPAFPPPPSAAAGPAPVTIAEPPATTGPSATGPSATAGPASTPSPADTGAPAATPGPAVTPGSADTRGSAAAAGPAVTARSAATGGSAAEPLAPPAPAAAGLAGEPAPTQAWLPWPAAADASAPGSVTESGRPANLLAPGGYDLGTPAADAGHGPITPQPARASLAARSVARSRATVNGLAQRRASLPQLPALPAPAAKPVRAALVVLILLASLLVGLLLGHHRTSPRGSSAATGPAGGAAHSRVLRPVGATAFDPYGGGQNSQFARLAIDGSAATAWHTQWYTTAKFGNLKPGTGLLIDLGRRVTITSARIMLGRAKGADFQLRVGATAGSLARLRVVAHAADAGGVVHLRLARPVHDRYVLIWFTRLPPDASGTFEASVYNVRLEGHR